MVSRQRLVLKVAEHRAEIRDSEREIDEIEQDVVKLYPAENFQEPSHHVKAGEERPSFRALQVGSEVIDMHQKLRSYRVGKLVKATLYFGENFGGSTSSALEPEQEWTRPQSNAASIKVFSTADAAARLQTLKDDAIRQASALALAERELQEFDERAEAERKAEGERLEREEEKAREELENTVEEYEYYPSYAKVHGIAMPSFFLRAFAALAGLLGSTSTYAAQASVEDSIAAPPLRPEDEVENTSPNAYRQDRLPLTQISSFDMYDQIRLAFYMIGKMLSPLRRATRQAILTDKTLFSDLLWYYVSGNIQVWELYDEYSPSFVYNFSGEAVKELIVQHIDARSYYTFLPLLVADRGMMQLNLGMVPAEVTHAETVSAADWVRRGKWDMVRALVGAARDGFCWTGGIDCALRNQAAIMWRTKGASRFHGLFFSDIEDIITVAMKGEIRGAKMADVQAERDVKSAATRSLYERLSAASKAARKSGRYDRTQHVEAVSALRRNLIHGLARYGLVARRNGKWVWVGSEHGEIVLRQVAELGGRVDSEWQTWQDQSFVVRRDQVLGEVTRVSELVDAFGEIGLVLVMALVRDGMVKWAQQFASGGIVKDVEGGEVVLVDSVAMGRVGWVAGQSMCKQVPVVEARRGV